MHRLDNFVQGQEKPGIRKIGNFGGFTKSPSKGFSIRYRLFHEFNKVSQTGS